MPGKDALQRLREATKAAVPPVPFVGAGLSLAVTGNSANAGWIGLLRDGVTECEREVPRLPQGWVGRMNDQLDQADVYTCIAVGDEIRRRLRDAGGERRFASWIDGAVGGLVATPEGKQIIRSVRGLGKFIVTTNYDTLIENLDPPWNPYTWTDREYRQGLRLENAVLHMHGVVGKPDSIILSSADYERLGAQKLAQVLNQAFFASLDFIYIGCGDGLDDPHIAPLMGFLDQVILQEDTQHYVLVRGDQLRQFQEARFSHLVSPVAYGRSFRDLGPFLSKLAAREEIEASQDPRFYEDVPAKPKRALLDLAAPAQEKLRRGVNTLQRVMHAMGQVEHRGTPPGGMGGWDYDDQQAVHEQLAASVTSPAAHLAKCSAEIVPVFTDLGADIGQLTAAKFAVYASELGPMIQAVSDLAQRSALLLTRVTVARDDLDARRGICTDYRVAYDSLCDAYTYIDQANSIVASLSEDLNGLTADQATGSRAASDLAARRSDLHAAASASHSTSASDAPYIQVVGKVAAGEPILIAGEDVEDLPLPSRYVGRNDIFALRVQGESMIGSGLLDGDYIIGIRELDPNNGEMVVVSFPGDDEEHREGDSKTVAT